MAIELVYSNIELEWQQNYPEGYQHFLALYNPYNLFYLKYYYIKHIRRYGYIKVKLLDSKETFEFILKEHKNRNGQTYVNGILFNTIYDAWNYYENAIFENIIKGYDSQKL